MREGAKRKKTHTVGNKNEKMNPDFRSLRKPRGNRSRRRKSKSTPISRLADPHPKTRTAMPHEHNNVNNLLSA